MTKIVTMTFEFEDEDFEEFLRKDEVQGDLRSWVLGEICQNQGFGFFTSFSVEDAE